MSTERSSRRNKFLLSGFRGVGYHRCGHFLSPKLLQLLDPEIAMKRKLFSSFALTAVLLCVLLGASAQSPDEGEVFQLVNRERSRAHLTTLVWDDRLAKLARDYSRQMAREGFFDHYDPRGRTVTDRALAARIRDWSMIGENLFMCEDHPYFATTAVRGWMRSQTHRTNILDRDWTTTGIGIATARDGSIFVTQVFTHE